MGPLTLTVLGCGDTFASGGRLQTCFAFSAGYAPEAGDGAGGWLLDCGATALVGLRRAGVDPNGVGAILVTHLHGDHFGGLPFFLLDAQLISRRTEPLVVAGPPGIEARTLAAMEVFFRGSSATPRRYALDFVELAERTPPAVGALTVTAYPVIHPSGAPAYALRVNARGRTIAYSGDTEWTDSLLEAARGADPFICEAYFFAKAIKYHLDYRTLRAKLADAPPADRPRRPLLTHMSADMLAHLGEIDVEVAEDGSTLTL